MAIVHVLGYIQHMELVDYVQSVPQSVKYDSLKISLLIIIIIMQIRQSPTF